VRPRARAHTTVPSPGYPNVVTGAEIDCQRWGRRIDVVCDEEYVSCLPTETSIESR
jgi:hypothetical protein